MAAKDSPRSAVNISSRDGRKAIARAQSSRRSGWLWLAAGVVVAAPIVVIVIFNMVKSSGPGTPETGSASLQSPPATLAVGAETMPPWPAPADASAAVAAAGLPMLGSELAVEHIHAHLDVLVDGEPVAVPAGLGIDTTRGAMGPLHTPDGSGVIHVESPVKRKFSLGEVFSEWQVSLSADNIGALRAVDGKAVRVFVNGAQQAGNPAAIMLGDRDEIAVVYCVPVLAKPFPRHTTSQKACDASPLHSAVAQAHSEGGDMASVSKRCVTALRSWYVDSTHSAKGAPWATLARHALPLGVAGHEGSTILVGLNGLRLLRANAWPSVARRR